MVPEDGIQDRGELTGSKPLMSTGASYYEVLDDLTQRRPDKAVTRFGRSTTQIMKDWLKAHTDHPYPTDEEKDMLKEQTGLSKGQIANWLANARRRRKIRSRRGDSPPTDWMKGSKPIPISQHQEADQSYMTPLERWKESPPEHEPANLTAIAKAVESTDFPEQDSGGSSQAQSLAGIRSSSGSNLSMLRAPSSTSLDTRRSSDSKGSFGSGKWSHGSRSSYGSFVRKENRRRRRTLPIATRPPANADKKARRFHCTFCTDTFHTKYDWTRHEKSLHLSLEQWTCAPDGPTVKSPNGTFNKCVYCCRSNPTAEHIATHNHAACEEKGLAARTFYRKDHLRQHLRLVHSVTMNEQMEGWKSTLDHVRSRCGFCPPDKPTRFDCWTARAEHLSKHFHAGCTMADWKGEHGFDPEIAAMVSHAMPPYMIAMDSRTPLPFSATQQNTWSSTWDEPTRELGKWVRTMQAQGQTITEDSLKGQARSIVYGEPDEWNTSRADHPEWLAAFKRTYGLNGPLHDLGGASSSLQHRTIDATTSDESLLGYSYVQGLQQRPDASTLRELSDATLWFSNRYDHNYMGNADTVVPQPSCYQLEAMELSAYINARKAIGQTLITDQELQAHARQLIYGTTEAWDITAADNPEWLRGMRAAHGIPDPNVIADGFVEGAKSASSLPTPLEQSTPLDEDLGIIFPGGEADLLEPDKMTGMQMEGTEGEFDGFWDPNLGLELDDGVLGLNLNGNASADADTAMEQ